MTNRKKKYDVVALGELLIDFAPAGSSAGGYPLFEANPGGAPANVLTAVTRQGGRAAFIGKVGEDAFGRLLEGTLRDCSIDTGGLRIDPDVRTTLAFVSLDETGNRSFSFFRNPGADYMLTPEEVDVALIRQANIFHFGSLSLTHEPARSATHYALEMAKESGAVISYDPNLRPPLWDNLDTAREQILSCMPSADIVKISDEEFTFLTGEDDYASHAPAFAERYGISLLFITLGPGGAYYHCNGHSRAVPTYDVEVVDTTGSGDAFIGAALGRISREGLDLSTIGDEALLELTSFANASGALTARAKGAIPAIPGTEMILDCMRDGKIG
ncbi:MAG: PfkB family carbohydrate kinase [Oscillospiraceae bacterium]